jgi:hypothetical protein
MAQPSAASGTTAPSPAAGTPSATETVTRPEPGLARGKWEAPAWAFWLAFAIVVIGTALYVLGRMGMLRQRKAPLTPPGRREPHS